MSTTQCMVPQAAGIVLMMLVTGCHRQDASNARENVTTDSVPAGRAAEQSLLESPRPATSGSDGFEAGMIDTAADDGARESIAVGLRQLADPQVTPAEWEAARQRVLKHGAAAVPGLTDGLKSENPLEREMAATLLAMIGTGLEQAEQTLRDALDDESAYVRANAATALCQLPGTEEAVIPVLAKLLESPDSNLRQMAATNLGIFGPEAAPFVETIADSLEVNRPEVLLPVVELLGRIGPPAEAAAPKLRQIVFEQTGEVQAAATAALERIETTSDSSNASSQQSGHRSSSSGIDADRVPGSGRLSDP